MQYLRLSDLKIGLNDLFVNRLSALQLSAMGRTCEPQLRSRYASIEALPPTLNGTPLAEQLAEEDARHDGFGAALWHLIQAYRVAPDVPAAMREAAVRVQQALVPSRAILKAAFADQVAQGQANRAKLDALASDLALFPLNDDRTMADWAVGFVTSADQIGGLLGQRADIDSQADTELRKQAGTLRVQTLGLLNQLRSAVRLEVELDTTLPRDLEARIFNYLDTLEGMREAASSSRSSSTASGSGSASTAPASEAGEG